MKTATASATSAAASSTAVNATRCAAAAIRRTSRTATASTRRSASSRSRSPAGLATATSARVYEGETIDLLDRPELCVRARFCDRFENAWRLTLKTSKDHPEIEEQAIYQANHCPGGRLTVRKCGVEIEPELPKEIGLIEDVYYETKGPIYVKGGITLESEDGSEYEIRNRRALCRCGHSRNMPFCDGSHLHCKHMKGLDE